MTIYMKSSLNLIACLLAAIGMMACSGHGGGAGPTETEPLPTGGAVFDFSYVTRGNTLKSGAVVRYMQNFQRVGVGQDYKALGFGLLILIASFPVSQMQRRKCARIPS